MSRPLESLTAAEVVARFRLEMLDKEGGWFRRVGEAESPPGGRRAWSAIQALFTVDQFSAMHRLDVDEVWVFHAGDPLVMLVLGGEGRSETRLIDPDHLQVAVPAGVWQGARPEGPIGWTLVSCLCVPGFQWEGFELGRAGPLIGAFPGAEKAIRRLTR